MKTQLTTRCLLRIILCVLVLGCRVWAGQFFFDDFSDGDPADGSPVNWVGVYDQEHSGYTLTPEGLKLSAAIAADPDGTPYIYRDVSVRAQIKRTSNHTDGEWVSGFCCRWNDGGPGGYWIEVRPPNRFWLGHRDRYVLRRATLPFNVDETELIIRVDMIGDQIKCWCWPADEPMPDEPQITLVEDVVPDGMFVPYAGTQGGQAIYRWVEAVSLEVLIGDFNGDEIVDTTDMGIMIDHWGENYSLCDIGPMPWGDGIVDIQDLIILAEHMCGYNHPIAHWTLDDREGSTAHDKVGENNASIYGGALWQPAEGMFGGALELDGIDDYAGTDFVLNPAGGTFSAFVWIKGGSPGQAIISQTDSIESGQTWLGTEPGTGKLLTELVPPHVGRFIPQPLKSEFIITDGQWHHIGFVWDGSYRYLYVDGIEVAKDATALTLAPLKSATGGLYIGAGKNLDAGTFFSGMIDDVRIYNQALTTEEIEAITW